MKNTMMSRARRALGTAAALCLAAAVTFATPGSARPGVNGYNVTVVVAPGTKFRLLTRSRWVEEGNNGARFNFVEERRDQWSVYLLDRSRGVRLQLDLHQKQIFYSGPNDPRRALYPVVDDSAEVKGWNVIWVSVPTGQYRMVGGNRWVERGGDGAQFNFVETQRDEWSVYLRDESRGVQLRLDLFRKQVFYADRSAPQPRPLYQVTGAVAVRRN